MNQGEEGEQENQNEEDSPPSSKRDLYVGNLYDLRFHLLLEHILTVRHPRVQPHMLKDLFGGDAMVENVKIVPDRNVFLLLYPAF